MKTALKFLAGLIAILVVVIAGGLTWLLNSRPDMSAFEPYFEAADTTPQPGSVQVRFFGTTAMLISDGTTNLMIDGWFTRPSTLSIILGTVEPDIAEIEAGLERLGVTEVAMVAPVHSHFDHAMDVAAVAQRTGAVVMGSESTAMIARGGGIPEDQILTPADREKVTFGDFTVSLIEGNHYVFASSLADAATQDLEITEPVIPPVPAMHYKQGKAYSILIEHPAGSMLVQGSAGYRDNLMDGIDVDVVMLGVGGIGSQTPEYQEQYWQQIVTPVSPEKIYAVHWDSFSANLSDLGNHPAAPDMLWDSVLGFDAAGGITYAHDHAESDGIAFGLLPLWEPVTVLPALR